MHININSLFSKFVYVKKVLDTEMIELIYLKLNIDHQMVNFLITYKPPNENVNYY